MRSKVKYLVYESQENAYELQEIGQPTSQELLLMKFGKK
jgi:hypothetical protein